MLEYYLFAVYRGSELPLRFNDEEVEDLLTRSLTQLDGNETSRVTQSQEEYEVVAQESLLPARPEVQRGSPLSPSLWYGLMDSEGRILDADGAKMLIFRGGVDPSLRRDVWKFLLDYYPWDSTLEQRAQIDCELKEQYLCIKTQWSSMSTKQEANHSEFRERKSLVEKDVNRTDRTDVFYAGDNNENLRSLHNLLMSYVMYNFDLGYVQGMSDLASPLLRLLEDEAQAFWCFVGFMERVAPHFEEEQAEMQRQLRALHELVSLVQPALGAHLRAHDSGNMFFCFRWLLVWFKRELSGEQTRRLWEVLWTGLPCRNFQLLLAAALLQSERGHLMRQRSFAGILKHVNELSGRLELESALAQAEGIYHQLAGAGGLPDTLRSALDLPQQEADTHISTSSSTSNSSSSEAHFQQALDMSYI